MTASKKRCRSLIEKGRFPYFGPGFVPRFFSQEENRRKKMANRTYEVMYIVNPETASDRIEKLNDAVGKLIEKEGGSVVKVDNICLKYLA